MKQMKFFLVALMTVVMGMTVTSCLKGDDNTAFVGPTYAKCVEIFPPTFQSFTGQKLVVSDMSLASLNTNDIYYLIYQFDTAVQDPNSPSLNVSLYGGIAPTVITAKSNEGPMNKNSNTETDAAFYRFNTSQSQPFLLFNESYVLIPIDYWLKVENSDDAQQKEFDKHSFVLTYDRDAITEGDTELVMTLNDVIADAEGEVVTRGKYTTALRAYPLENAIREFTAKAGNKPTKIKIETKTNMAKNSLDGASNSSWSYTFKQN